MIRSLVLAIATLLATAQAGAAELKIATWNLDWLTTRPAGDRHLPADVEPRSPEDFDRLAGYGRELNADIIAIEEVDGFAAASRLFPKDLYSIHFTHDHVVQRVGIAVRRGLQYDVNPDLTALAEHHLRSGADITLHLHQGNLRILAVHLKKGCRDMPVAMTHSLACEELKQQVPPLEEWIEARREEGIPFVILGDFNRWMDDKDTLLDALSQSGRLMRATQGLRSPCWGGESFIDHILAGGSAADWMEPGTTRVLVYRETGREWQDRLSDHCPVSVRFRLPD